MGNRFSRRREAPANGAETAATEQKPEEPVATQQAEAPQIQEVVEAEKPAAAVVEEPAAAVPEPVAEPIVESVPEPEVPAAAAPLVEVTPEPVAEEVVAPPPVQLEPEPEPEPEPLVSISAPPEPVVEPEPIPEPVVEPEPIPEPIVEPVPVVEPEPIPEPILEPEPELDPVPTLEQEIDLLTQVSLPEPLFSSAPLVDLGVPDLTPSPAHSPVIPDEPADLPEDGECHGIIEAAVNSMPVPEESKESWESLEKPLEPESVGAGNVEQLLCDVNSEVADSGLLKHLDLTGNDLVNDLIPNDINIPDDIPIANMSGSSELQ